MNIRTRSTRSWSIGAVLGLFVAMSAALVFSSSSVQAYPECECSGAYICPTDGADFEYDPPTCGPTRTQAHAACEAHCDVTCADTGWGGC